MAEVATAATGAVTGAAAAVGSTVNSSVNKASSAISSTIPAPLDSSDTSLVTELASAKAEIASLRKQLAQAETNSSTLRSRSVVGKGPVSGDESSTAQAVAHQVAAGGVPVPIVAGIVVGAVVLTWYVAPHLQIWRRNLYGR